MKPREAEKHLASGAVGRSVFKAERHIPKPGSRWGEEASVHLYPIKAGGGFLWAIRRHGYSDNNIDGLAILRAGVVVKDVPLTGAVRAAISELYRRLPPPKRRSYG